MAAVAPDAKASTAKKAPKAKAMPKKDSQAEPKAKKAPKAKAKGKVGTTLGETTAMQSKGSGAEDIENLQHKPPTPASWSGELGTTLGDVVVKKRPAANPEAHHAAIGVT